MVDSEEGASPSVGEATNRTKPEASPSASRRDSRPVAKQESKEQRSAQFTVIQCGTGLRCGPSPLPPQSSSIHAPSPLSPPLLHCHPTIILFATAVPLIGHFRFPLSDCSSAVGLCRERGGGCPCVVCPLKEGVMRTTYYYNIQYTLASPVSASQSPLRPVAIGGRGAAGRRRREEATSGPLSTLCF